MTQVATVTRIISPDMAEIAVKRKSACGGDCHACGGTCNTGKILKVSARNAVAAGVGDQVLVSSSTSGILKAAFVVYLIPIILFFVFYAAAVALALPESGCVAASLGGFALGVLCAVLVNRSLKGRAAANFEIIQII